MQHNAFTRTTTPTAVTAAGTPAPQSFVRIGNSQY
jgi:hypothetical protein